MLGLRQTNKSLYNQRNCFNNYGYLHRLRCVIVVAALTPYDKGQKLINASNNFIYYMLEDDIFSLQKLGFRCESHG